jgi:hypothetical protein
MNILSLSKTNYISLGKGKGNITVLIVSKLVFIAWHTSIHNFAFGFALLIPIYLFLLHVQLMSQLLYYFRVENERDPVDWATIVVYTCRESCDKSVSYKEEFVRVQFSPPTRRTYGCTP